MTPANPWPKLKITGHDGRYQMAGPTPGPWVADDDAEKWHGRYLGFRVRSRQRVEGTTLTYDQLGGSIAHVQTIEDAALIAAAPDLLAALREAIRRAGEDGYSVPQAWRQLVARAEGRRSP